MLLKNNKAIADDFDIIVNDTTLNLTDDMAGLGITIDSQLNFNVHVSNMCNEAGTQLNFLKRLKGSLDYSRWLSIYKSFIMSNFNYCPVVWMFTSKSSLSNLEGIQKRALRFLLGDYTSDYVELLDKANVPGMKIMALGYLAIEVYKCINGINPKYLNDLSIIKERKYELRNVSIIDRDKAQTTNHGIKSFKDYGAKICPMLANRLFQLKILKCLSNPGTGQNVLAQYVSLLLDSDIFIVITWFFLAYYILYHEYPYDAKGNENYLLDDFMTEWFIYVLSCVLLYIVHVFIIVGQ